MYVIQTVLHAFIALIIIELSFYAWDIKDHLSRFRYRLMPLVLPIFMYPLYQIITPERGSWHFRLTTALFDSQRWLELKLLGLFPVALLILIVLAGITGVFLFQEIFPIFRRRNSQPRHEKCVECEEDVRTLLQSACVLLGIEEPGAMVIETPAPVLFTQGYKRHLLVISSGLVRTLDREQLKNALIHEVVHMKRSSNLKTQMIYLFRMLMFYNPVSLVEFRRIVHDDEFICDAITLSMTSNPQALISALSAFYYHPEDLPGRLSQIKEQVESHSHNLLLNERIKNLTEGRYQNNARFGLPQYLLTMSAILLIGYGVV
jgi:beta-lactamase regulating signal transducer with metallopeptidase domain